MRPVSCAEVGERQWWEHGESGYDDLEPGNYRFQPIHVEFWNAAGDAGDVTSNGVSFTVVAHPGNHLVAASTTDLCRRLHEQARWEHWACNALISTVVENRSVSAGYRGWIPTKLAECYFDRFDYAACREAAAMVAPNLLPLPCGGLGTRAEFYAVRTKWMQAKTRAEWDREYLRLDSFKARFPEFLAATRYPTYPSRREHLFQ